MAPFVSMLVVLFAAVALGARILLQWARTGDTGLRLGQALSWSRAGAAKLCLGGGVTVAGISPFAVWFGKVSVLFPSALLTVALGLAIYVLGLTLTFVAQLQMGASWRIGVDPRERTALITTGLFRWVRNPIYSAVLLCFGGCALLLPTTLAVAGWLVILLAVQLQVRLVEEPYLLDVHGQAYREYASRVGRFVPGLGKSPLQR